VNSIDDIPGPFKTVEDAQGEVSAFIQKLHKLIDDELTDFAEQFTMRAHYDLATVLQDAATAGGSLDAIENTPEYDLFYANSSMVIQHVLDKFRQEWASNIYGTIQWKIRQQERALVGAPD
jgi:hypothetical protein